jgi:hypothetical protein
LLACAVIVLCASVGHAQTTPIGAPTLSEPEPPPPDAADLDTTRGLALGTGIRASAMSTSALAYDPAAMALARVYHIESSTTFVPTYGRWIFGGAIVDSNTSRLAAGLSFRGILGDGNNGWSGLDGRLGLGFPIIDELAIGISGRYLSLSREGQAPAGVDPDEPLAQGFTMDGSIVVAPMEGLRIAALANNFIDLGSDIVPVTFGGSASLTLFKQLTLGGDVLVDISTYESPSILAGGGVEFLAANIVPLRVGYRYDDGRGSHFVTGGVGYVDAKFGIDLSLRQEVDGDQSTELQLALRYFVQ